MNTLSRKQREVRQREAMLLGVARKMLIEQGYAGLSMDRLAEATEYSKGTVYQHFSTKEDLVTALSVESNGHRLALFTRAREFPGRPRERLLALGVADELFVRLHPHHFRSEQIIHMAGLEDRASSGRRETLVRQEGCVVAWIRETVDEAVAAGDLRLALPMTAGGVAFGVFAMAIGTHTTMVNFTHVLQELQVGSPLVTLRDNIHAFLDGLGWRPLRAEWDYDATARRIAQEVFADEYRQAGLA